MKNLFKNLALALLLTAALTAQAGPGHRSGAGGPATREVKAYVEANVLPVLRQQRLKLEAQLAPADQQALAGYRAQLQALKAEGKEQRKSMGIKGKSQLAVPAEEPTAPGQDVRSQMRTIMGGVLVLAQKYSANMEQLTSELAPKKAQWTTDITAIVQKDATPEQKEKMAHWQDFAGHHSALGRLLRPAFFLLLEPAAPAATVATSLYPNPATATTQLQYEVQKAGFVRIDLLDGSGNQLRTLAPELRQEVGVQTKMLDLSNLAQGTYFYKITTPSGTGTKRFVKE